MVCAPVRTACRLYWRTNHALSHLYQEIHCKPVRCGVSGAKDWVSVDYGTNANGMMTVQIWVCNVCLILSVLIFK